MTTPALIAEFLFDGKSALEVSQSTAYQMGWDDFEAGAGYRGDTVVSAYLEIDYRDGYEEARDWHLSRERW